MFTRARLICAGLLAAATTAVLVGAPAVVQADHPERARLGELTMTGRIRLLWAALFAAATTAALVGAPAMIHAGITFNGID